MFRQELLIVSRIAKLIGAMWRELPEAEKLVWRRRQEQARREHETLYPHYKYEPSQTWGKGENVEGDEEKSQQHEPATPPRSTADSYIMTPHTHGLPSGDNIMMHPNSGNSNVTITPQMMALHMMQELTPQSALRGRLAMPQQATQHLMHQINRRLPANHESIGSRLPTAFALQGPPSTTAVQSRSEQHQSAQKRDRKLDHATSAAGKDEDQKTEIESSQVNIPGSGTEETGSPSDDMHKTANKPVTTRPADVRLASFDIEVLPVSEEPIPSLLGSNKSRVTSRSPEPVMTLDSSRTGRPATSLWEDMINWEPENTALRKYHQG